MITTNRLRPRTLGTAAALAAAVACTAILPAAAQAAPHPLSVVTVSGDVTCNQGGAVEGVWIQAAGGSGWASGTSVFNKSGVTPPWTVHVGCGGSPANWEYTVYGVKSINSSFANWGCYPFGPPGGSPGCYTTVS